MGGRDMQFAAQVREERGDAYETSYVIIHSPLFLWRKRSYRRIETTEHAQTRARVEKR